MPSAVSDQKEVAWRKGARLFPLAWGYSVCFSLLTSIVGTIKIQKNIVGIIIGQEDGESGKNMLLLVKSLSCRVCGLLLSGDNKFVLTEGEGVVAVNCKEGRVSQTRKGPVWPEGSPWCWVGPFPFRGQSGQLSLAIIGPTLST